MVNVAGETIIVTGASRGLGRAMSVSLSRAGARVVLVARDERRLHAVAAETEGETLVSPTDVRNHTEVERAVKSCRDQFGYPDTLINNAGVGLLSFGEGRKRVHEIDVDQWETILRTNVCGPFLFSHEVLPLMVDQGHGNVINVSSELGRRAIHGWAAYVTSKFGMEGFTKTAALEYEEAGVNVNAVYPGGRVATSFWNHLPEDELSDLQDADVMNEAIKLLACQGPAGITGESYACSKWESVLG